MEVSKPPKKFKEDSGMQKTEEFVEKIKGARLNKVRNERLNYLWDDFLGAVEKVINVLTDEELAATYWITIKYEIRKNGKVIYRSRFAETDWSGKRRIKYEPKDINLGSKKLLERPFWDFREKARQDEFYDAGDFYIEDLFEEDGPGGATLDFRINRIETIPEKSETSEYRIVSK